jgi:DNA-binding transcriptional regulator YhcF (GntR family)
MALAAEIASSIERDYIDSVDNGLLPTIIELAKHYRVSTVVAHQACKELRDHGLISTSKGRRARILRAQSANREDQPPAARPNAVERCAGRIMAMIQSGRIKYGEMMPKVDSLASELHMGIDTVCRAYRNLAEQGYIHRKGRHFHVGAGHEAQARYSGRSAKSLLLLHLNAKKWHASLKHHWSSPFLAAFMREATNMGVCPVAAHMEEGHTPSDIVSGKSQIQRTIEKLGDRCIGILVAANASDVETALGESLAGWISWLVSLKKPVLWFDIDENGDRMPFAEEYLRLVARMKKTDRFIRCAFNGMALDTLVLTQLARQGHRSIGLPWSGKQYAWLTGRIAGLRRAAEGLPWKLTLTSCNNVEPLLRIRPDTSIGAVLEVLSREPALSKLADLLAATHRTGARFDHLPDADKELINMIAVAGPFLTTHRVTALISLSDRMAGKIYRWLRAAGIDVPGSMSIISYDDRIETLYPYAISSANFGFDNLAFRGLHALLGDLAIRPDRNRTITIAPRLNHTATLGPAHQ